MFYKKTVLAHGPRRSIVGGSAVTTGAAAAGQLPLSHVVQHGIRGGRSERYRLTVATWGSCAVSCDVGVCRRRDHSDIVCGP